MKRYPWTWWSLGPREGALELDTSKLLAGSSVSLLVTEHRDHIGFAWVIPETGQLLHRPAHGNA